MRRRNKLLIWANALLGVAAVFIAAVSTAAWFQIDSQAPETTIKTQDPNLVIDDSNVTGYKVNPVIGSDGFIDKTSNTVTSKKGQTYDTSNNHQDDEDPEFDIPDDGLGYYLVKKNPSGSFKYKYDGDSYSRKFTDYSVSTVYNKYIENDGEDFLTLAANDLLEVKKYSYNTSTFSTVNVQVTGIVSENTSIATIDSYNNIKIVTGGTYKVWFNSNSKKIAFESAFNPYSANRAARIALPKEVGTTTTTSPTATQIYVVDRTNSTTGNKFQVFRLSGLSFASGYGHEYFQTFIESYLTGRNGGTAVNFSSTSFSRPAANTLPVTISNTYWCARNGTSDYYIRVKTQNDYGYGGSNYVACYIELPEWVTAVSFRIYGNDWWNCGGGDSSVWGSNSSTIYDPDAYNLSSTWGIGKDLRYFIYDNSGWRCETRNSSHTLVNGDNSKFSAFTKNWGSATISKTGYCGSTSLGSVGSETVTKYYIFDTPTAPNAKSGYTFTGNWYKNSALSTSLGTLFITGNVTIYAKYLRVWAMTLTPSYFVNNGDGTYTRLNLSIQATQTENITDGNAFSTTKSFANVSYIDTTNAIGYTFTRANNSWYSDAACTKTYSGIPDSNKTLYAKMVCAPLVTYYVDVSQTGWSGCNLHGWDTPKGGLTLGGSPGAGSDFVCKSIIANNLYRVTVPNDLTGFLIHNGYGGGGNNQSNNAAISTTYNYTLLGDKDGSNRWIGWISEKDHTSSSGRVQQWNGSTWVDIATMDVGDGDGNKFIYEKGLRLSVGTIVRLYDGSTGYGYSDYVSGNLDKHPYIATGRSGAGITLSHYSGTARFNFYLTSANKVSIAMVPDYGNGYYIMPYNTSVSTYTEHFIGAIKMDSNDYSAIYTGYYSAGGSANRIFIKSYLNAVDTLATSLTSTTTSDIATMDGNGIITFTTSGRYTIQVTNKTVDISRYEVGDFFSLNSLDTSPVTSAGDTSAKQTAIYNQKTSLILEVPFTCKNPYASNITLLTNCNVSYIGVNLYVSLTQLGTGATIYSTLRGASSPNSIYTGLVAANTTTPVTDKHSCSIPANRTATCYAYILIDYMPTVVQSDLTGAAPEFKLYLQSNQP